MGTIERKIISLYEDYKKQNDGEEPKYLGCQIRYKDDGSVLDVIIALFEFDVDVIDDDRIFYYVSNIKDVLSMTTNVEINQEDYDSVEDYEKELNKYAETEEDKEYYFPCMEDFDIIDAYEMFNIL